MEDGLTAPTDDEDYPFWFFSICSVDGTKIDIGSMRKGFSLWSVPLPWPCYIVSISKSYQKFLPRLSRKENVKNRVFSHGSSLCKKDGSIRSTKVTNTSVSSFPPSGTSKSCQNRNSMSGPFLDKSNFHSSKARSGETGKHVWVWLKTGERIPRIFIRSIHSQFGM